MDRKGQMLVIEPPDVIVFDGSLTTTIYITNPTTHIKMGYKVKTSTPRKYSVRPSYGTILPQQKIPLTITADISEIAGRVHKREKLMIQSLMLPNNSKSMEESWQETDPDLFMNSKLKCVFQPKKTFKNGNSISEVPEDYRSILKNTHNKDSWEKILIEEFEKIRNENPDSIASKTEPNIELAVQNGYISTFYDYMRQPVLIGISLISLIILLATKIL